MSDKYDKFKEWLKDNDYKFVKKDDEIHALHYSPIGYICNLFESELKEKEKKEKIKTEIMKALCHSTTALEWYGETPAEAIYNTLKEGGYLNV